MANVFENDHNNEKLQFYHKQANILKKVQKLDSQHFSILGGVIIQNPAPF